MEIAKHLIIALIGLLKRGGIWWGVAISLSAAVLSFAVAVAIVVGWAPDRFSAAGPVQRGPRRSLAIPGVPGQGLLTAVIGITLLNLPGKLKVERRLLRMAAMRRGLNRLRARWHR